jgi:opacity protein-like surface antigen
MTSEEDSMGRAKNLHGSRCVFVVAVAVALLGAAGSADAQDREGRWEFTLGAIYQLGTEVDAQNGGSLDTGDDFGFTLGGGYNFTDRLAATFGLEWAGIDYDARATDPETGSPVNITGGYDQFILSGNLVLNLTDGPLVPYVGAGIGWTWIDTNIPNGPPLTWCWWDPWWGYVCSTSYPTATIDAFSYQALLGLRYEFDNDRTFLRLGYTSQWMDFDASSGTPRFDVIVFDFGWIF